MTLTVFTPTYNRAHTLVRIYESMCYQTCKDFEWLVIDDGSTDDTATLVDKWKREDRIPILYVYKENGGPATARNLGIEEAIGDYIAFLDSDDIWLPNKIEIQIYKH